MSVPAGCTAGPWVWVDDEMISRPDYDRWLEWQKLEESEEKWEEDYVPSPTAIIETDGGVYGPQEPDRNLISAAPDLYAACRSMVDWFEAFKAKQHTLLVEGQSFQSASDNWDAATLNHGFDLTEMMAALAKAEGRP